MLLEAARRSNQGPSVHPFFRIAFRPVKSSHPFHRHVDVGRRDLDGVDAAPLLLAGNECGARPDERIVDVALVVVDGSLHALDGLLGRVAGFRFPGVVDLPEGRGFTVALPVGLRAPS